LLRRVERMHDIIRQLQRAQFGRHSERLDPDQLRLALEEREIASAHKQAAAEKQATVPRTRTEAVARKSLPAHLLRIEVVVEPETTSCPCCGSGMHVIGEEKSERLDVIPAQHRILVTRRPKYGCRACSGAVVQAPAPERLIRSGLPTEALVAHVLVSKYAWHLPLYRQAQIMLAQGIEIDRSVLAFWVGYAAAELMPLWRRMREILLGSPRLFVDETRAPVLDPGRGRTKTGYFWSIARDDSAWSGGTGPPAVAYTYTPGRGAEHAMRLLAGYHGIVQCDGYAAYKQVAHRGRAGNAVILAFCWAHWRRRFYEIAKGGGAPIAEEALRRIAALYTIEAQIRGNSAAERRAVRQAESKPVVEALKTWLAAQLARASAKSAIAVAIRYGFNHWEGLSCFLDDGRIEIDSNVVERSMRPIALNRKNALFAGHDTGAENWACLASLIETCKLNGVDPQTYLTDVLTKLVNLWPASRLDELMPWAWSRGELAA
jgi:transposase